MRRVGKTLLLAAFAVHFFFTALYVAPANPLHAELWYVLNKVYVRFFPQNWNLFAPVPIMSDYSLLARCESDETGEHSAKPTEWTDLTGPLTAHHQVHRLSAYDRLARIQMTTMRRFIAGGGPELEYMNAACTSKEGASCQQLLRHRELVRAEASKKLARIASAVCLANPATAGASNVRLRVRARAAVPWIDRETALPASIDVDVGHLPVQRDVAPATFMAVNFDAT